MPELDLTGALGVRVANQDVLEVRIGNQTVWEVGEPLPSPIAAYTFSEGTGSTSADTSGNGRTFTLPGGSSWPAGRVGSGFMPGNANANPVALGALPVFTVMGWVNIGAVGGVLLAIHSALGGYGGTYGVNIEHYNNAVHIWTAGVAGAWSELGSVNVPVGTSVHIALTSDGINVEWFFDGVSQGGGQPTIPSLPQAYLMVGSDDDNQSATATALDDVRVFDTVLSQADIAAYVNI